MNTESIIEYIRRSNGLRSSKKSFWALIFCFIAPTAFMMSMGIMTGGIFKVIGVVSCVSHVALAVFVLFFLRKNSPLKNLLIAEALNALYILCFLADLFGALYMEFNLLEERLIYYYLVLIILPIFLILFNARRFNNSSFTFSKKVPIKVQSIFAYRSKIALGTLIFGLCYKSFGHLISERTIEMFFFLVLIVAMYIMSCSVLDDMQRYYYFTKLEKMGLVTEDILKPDK